MLSAVFANENPDSLCGMVAVVPSSHLCDFGAVWGHAKGAGEDAQDGLWSEQGYS